MASWAVHDEQVVWIAQVATGFTIVCERCVELGENFPSAQGTLALEHARGTITCPRGHELRIERDGR